MVWSTTLCIRSRLTTLSLRRRDSRAKKRPPMRWGSLVRRNYLGAAAGAAGASAAFFDFLADFLPDFLAFFAGAAAAGFISPAAGAGASAAIAERLRLKIAAA